MASTPTSGADTINGTASNDKINALAGDDIVYGRDGNDTLIGGAGKDRLYGGNGNDIYFVDNVLDRAIEAVGNTHTPGGRDIVRSTVNYTIGAYVEDLVLLGTTAVRATGNGLNNRLTGNNIANTLDGRAGVDVMSGKAGNDSYIVDNSRDRAVEAVGQGTDTVRSTVNFTLGANVENLILTGAQDVDGTGNALNNRITGNSGDNTLTGGDGNDVITGGRDGDEINGGAGADRLVYGSALDSTGINFDTVTGFNFEEDKIDVTGAPPVFQGDIIQGGRLDEDTFDADLAAAVNSQLGVNEAVVFVPTSGDFAGKTFLVVDDNGQAGYQVGGDFVVRVEDSAPPTNTDFFV